MMALIYANAVNKRMSQPYKPRKKHSSSGCPFRDESPLAIREGSRKCSSSREPTPQRKTSSTSSSNGSPVLVAKREHKHRPVQRSKTSCGDMLNRIDEEGLRKTSSPAMSGVGNGLTKSFSKGDIKKALAKKTLIQKYNLEHQVDSPIISDRGSRRRSVSLDADEWEQQCTQTNERKDSAFQRMKKKLSKWTLG